jgi:hypothetical protein
MDDHRRRKWKWLESAIDFGILGILKSENGNNYP